MKKEFFQPSDVEKYVPKVWAEIAKYLGLRTSWKGLLKIADESYENFIGFNAIPSTETNWAIRNFFQPSEKGIISSVEMTFNPVNKGEDYTRFVVGHELVHFYRQLVIPNFEILIEESRIFGIFEEAYGDVVSANSVVNPKLRRKCLGKTCSYGVLEVAMLESVLLKMSREELRSYADRPFAKRDVPGLLDEVIGLLLQADRDRWVKDFFGKKKR